MNRIFSSILVVGVFLLAGQVFSEEIRERPVVARTKEVLVAIATGSANRVELGDFWAPSWAPDGTKTAVLVQRGDLSYPAILELSGSGHYLFPERLEGTFV